MLTNLQKTSQAFACLLRCNNNCIGLMWWCILFENINELKIYISSLMPADAINDMSICSEMWMFTYLFGFGFTARLACFTSPLVLQK